jgi:hypothetical protein
MTQSTDRADAASKHCRAACPAARALQMAVPARVATTRGRTILTSVNSPSCVSMNAAFQPNSAARIEGLTAFYRSLAGVGPHVSERARPGCQRHPTRTAHTEA